jgi:cytochrome c-type biogenesis protein CcmH/NrfG
VIAWNNLGDALERQRDFKGALAAYTEAVTYDPGNQTAKARKEFCETKLQRLGGV